MDKRELRESLGNNQHYHPEKNPHPVGTPPKSSILGNMNFKPSSPVQIGGATGKGSPAVASSPLTEKFSQKLIRSASTDEHKDSILT